MTRTTSRLTALKVDKAKQPGMYADGGGLYLRVTNEGTKNWVFRFMLNGRPRWMGIGPLALYGLQEAREKALDARRLRHDGVDPIDARRAERAQDAARGGQGDHVQAVRRRATSPRTAPAGATPSTPRNGRRRSRPMPIRSSARCRCRRSTPALVMQGAGADLDGEARDGEPGARAHRGRCSIGRRRAAIATGENPARWRGHLDKLLPARAKVRRVEHHAALPYAEMPGFMAELRAAGGYCGARARIRDPDRGADRRGDRRARGMKSTWPTRLWTDPRPSA